MINFRNIEVRRSYFLESDDINIFDAFEFKDFADDFVFDWHFILNDTSKDQLIDSIANGLDFMLSPSKSVSFDVLGNLVPQLL